MMIDLWGVNLVRDEGEECILKSEIDTNTVSVKWAEFVSVLDYVFWELVFQIKW